MRHCLDLLGLTRGELNGLIDAALAAKAARRDGRRSDALAGRTVAMVFEKPSLRTRVSFEAGVAQLGGAAMFFPGQEVGLGWRETLGDFTRTIQGYVDCLVMRVKSHATLKEVAGHAKVPVVNALSDRYHPCQALADVTTVRETHGSLDGKTVAFIGDGNNVARSLAVACGKLGARFFLASPGGYGFDDEFLRAYREYVGPEPPESAENPREVAGRADVIYTDVWTSMGQEGESEERTRRFMPFQVNGELLKLAPAGVTVMHCLPARRGEEVTDEVLDGPHSVVFQQAENRMHAQKALLCWLLGVTPD